jgi:hypothetical protein
MTLQLFLAIIPFIIYIVWRLSYKRKSAKRYLVFFGEDYEYWGGMLDFIGSYDTIEECKKIVDTEKNKRFGWKGVRPYEETWYNILDTHNMVIIACPSSFNDFERQDHKPPLEIKLITSI